MNSNNIVVLRKILYAVESGGQVYGNQDYAAFIGAGTNTSNEVAITIGAGQWYGTEAKTLLNRIRSAYPTKFAALDTQGIASDLDSKNWSTYSISTTSAKAKCIVAIISSEEGIKCQDALMEEQIVSYAASIEKTYGSMADTAMMECINIIHQGGSSALKRILAKTQTPYTLETIYAALCTDPADTSNNNQVGDYVTRQKKVYEFIKTYADTEDASTDTDTEETVSEIDAIYAVAVEETGYLEKKTNAYLDDKTANAGYNNYTKYWRDLRLLGLMASYGYPASGNFAGGTDWPYCAAGVNWAFIQALGLDRAQELLLHTSGAALINCQTMYDKADKAKQIVDFPAAGDIILFYNSSGHYHMGLVYKVEGSEEYTIEWNTSGASSVIANGGGVCAKHYTIASTKAHYFRPAYNSTASTTTSAGSGTSVTMLKYGSTGDAVQTMQTMLITLGYSCGKYGADGEFGADTLDAVIAFQDDHDLEADGVYGPLTATALNTAYAAKVTGSTTKPSESARLFVGKCTGDDVNVRTWAGTEYGNITSWPKLNKGNLVDVLDYTQTAADGSKWYYVRIADKYHGFVHSKYIARA